MTEPAVRAERRLPAVSLEAVGALALFGIAYYLAYRFGMSFSQAVPAPLWFPDAVLLSALLLTPPRAWPFFVAATAPVRFWLVPGDPPFWFLLAAFVNDSLKAALAAEVLRKLLRDPTRFDRMRDFGLFVGVAVLAAPALSAFAGAAAWHALGRPFGPAWQEWFLGDAMANLLLTPAILYWVFEARERRKAVPPGRPWEAAALAAGLVAVAAAAFFGRVPAPYDALLLLYAPLPFLLWAAFRFGLRGTSAVLTLSAVFVAEAAGQGRGAFAAQPPDQRILWIQLFMFVVALPVLFLAVLVKERNEGLAKLQEREERYREVVNAQTDLICRYRPDTTLTFVNEAYCRYFGRPREDLIGRSFLELIPEAARGPARAHVLSLVERPRLEPDEHEVVRSDGSIGWQQWVDYAVYGRDGRVLEFQGIGRDITDRKRADEADRRVSQAGRLALLGELTASIAHEINQPLGAILSNADALEMLLDAGGHDPTEIRAILSDIRRDGIRASEVIRHVRSLVKKKAVEMQAIDLNAVAEETLRFVGTEARRRGVTLVSELAATSLMAKADAVGLQQVLLNLLVNGMDAMGHLAPGRRRLTLRTRRVGETEIELSVVDVGHGISPDLLPRLFDSFVTTRDQGMGLGLSLSRSVVEAHGGRILASNNPTGGATIRVSLPAA